MWNFGALRDWGILAERRISKNRIYMRRRCRSAVAKRGTSVPAKVTEETCRLRVTTGNAQ